MKLSSCIQLVQYNEYLVSTVATDGLVHTAHQGINNYSAEYAPMLFLFWG